jgi:hypothetical protein
MILPQTAAFNSLQARLKTVSTLSLSNVLPPSRYSKSKSSQDFAKELDIDTRLLEFQSKLSQYIKRKNT